jgi:phosphoglucosamine mutase
MARKLFGTDGIRGLTNIEPMTAETALRVAMATAIQLRRGNHRHRVVIAKDTRLSGYMFEPALAAGFISMGLDVVMVWPLPTPAVAMLTRSLRADLGVMISASHNAYEDNGIKLFGPDGYKLSDAVEAEIEQMVDGSFTDRLAPASMTGSAVRLEDASGRYIEYVKNTFPKGLTLDGLKIVVDCAHGAAYKVAPRVLYELGADVVPIAVKPDGKNINDKCGAVAPEAMQEAVVLHGADIGIALDGDADRLILADEYGRRVDGDQIMALVTRNLAAAGLLKGGGLVATIMSNLGLEHYLRSLDLRLVRTPVGDRHVVDHMRAHGFNVGGEQSGHIVLGDYSTTGDGLIAALQVLACIRQRDRPASEILKLFEPMPQLLRSVRYSGGHPLEQPAVKRSIADAERRLGGTGRVSVRRSGTEPVIRVMAEGEDPELVRMVVDSICDAIQDFDHLAAAAE